MNCASVCHGSKIQTQSRLKFDQLDEVAVAIDKSMYCRDGRQSRLGIITPGTHSHTPPIVLLYMLHCVDEQRATVLP
ncbi:hypothetical protein V1264_001018 [Littorina saxatilis]|uniref:Uncharacterized protein n=1 Tax=Littorina saxatilis TaxID=31220 RepID=A0AAN9C0I9_9CAEN